MGAVSSMKRQIRAGRARKTDLGGPESKRLSASKTLRFPGKYRTTPVHFNL
jgi:hypothetical protein